MNELKLTKELSEKMDNLLSMGEYPGCQVCAPAKDKDEYNEYLVIIDYLQNMGYAQKIAGNVLTITPAGIYFVKNGGFKAKYKRKKKAAIKEILLTAWGIITTLISLCLALF